MRKGAPRVEWTVAEIDYLRAAAGFVPRREICRELKRSSKSVEHMASRLGLSLRVHESRLEWCATCAAWRSTVSNRDGRCAVCRKKESLQRAEARVSEAFAKLTPEQKRVYQATESARSTRKLPPRPSMPPSSPASRYQRAKAHEQHAREVERWEAACLDKRIDAAKKRLERMRRKTGTNPRSKNK